MQKIGKIFKVSIIIGVLVLISMVSAVFAQIEEDLIVYLPVLIRGEPQPTSTPTPPTGNAIVINHNSVESFEQIPANYILAAQNSTSLFRHASVGVNIDDGLDCLGNEIIPRPSMCDRDLEPDEILYDEIYNRENWDFELHSTINPNPGWWNKVTYFYDRVNGLPTNSYQVVAFKFGYVDGVTGTNIDDIFFNNDPNDNFPSVEDLEALEVAHPDKIQVYWTMGLARAVGTADAQSFNEQMRSYAMSSGKILMDIADILSHDANGNPCFYNGYEAMCEEYTDEIQGGHLNARGKQQMAKAYWVLMARIAGWDGSH